MLDEADVTATLTAALTTGGDWAEIYTSLFVGSVRCV